MTWETFCARCIPLKGHAASEIKALCLEFARDPATTKEDQDKLLQLLTDNELEQSSRAIQ